MSRPQQNRGSVWGGASPSQVAVFLNVVIALVVSTAVVLHLRTQRTQALHNVQVQVANMAHAQALLIANQVSSYDSLLGQLEIRLNVAKTLVGRNGRSGDWEGHVHDLLRNFHDLATDNMDLLLVAEDGSFQAASNLLDTQDKLPRYCKDMDLSPLAPGTTRLLVYTGQGAGRCPAAGTLIYQKALRPQAGRTPQVFWLLFDSLGFQSALQKDSARMGSEAQYRVLGAAQEVLLSSSPDGDPGRWDFPAAAPAAGDLPTGLPPDLYAAQWQHPDKGHWLGGVQATVPGTDLRVQMVYRTEEAIAPVWRPLVRVWGSLAAGFLFLWWLVSFFVVKMVRKHQADIQTREQRFDRSLDYAELGVWDWDIPSGRLFWSKRAAPMLGYPDTVQETHNDVYMAAVHPDDRDLVEQSIARSLQYGEPYAVSLRVVWPDQSVHWLREWGNVQRDAHGKPIRMLGVVQDITEQHAIRKHQRLLETVVSQLNDVVCITDNHAPLQGGLRIVFVNHAFEEHSGYTREAAIGMPLTQLFGPQTDAQDISGLFQALEAQTPLRTEMLLYTQSGDPRWMELNIQPLLEADGHASNWVVVARDTSQRKLAEAALKGSENRLSGVLESAMDAIISIDESHRIILFNGAAQKTFGRSSEEMLGQPLDILLPAGMRALHAQHLHNYHHSTQELNNNRIMAPRSHLKALRANGQEFPIEASISRAVVDGGTIFTVILRDMTERLEAERKLRELNESLEHRVVERTQALQEALHSAEQAKRSRGEFLAKMSHEMRTPMNAVLGLTYLALRSQPQPEQAALLEKIQRAGNHLLHTINDILDFSKIDAGKLQIDMEGFDLQQSIHDGMQMIEEKALEKHLTLHVHIDSDVPRYAVGDALRLMQVLINYVNNAIKFTQTGFVAVRIQRVAEPADAPPAADFVLRVEVEDSGIGLSPDQMARLFESFEQADNSTTRKFGGTGLGLAICKQLATLMGGQAGAHSREGQGSVFWFTARLQHCTKPQCTELGTDRDSLLRAVQGRHVLVVDDNDLNLEVALGILQDWGVHAAQALDGLQALAVLRSQPVDLVLMDMHMPVMDGLEACRQIRADATLAGLPVIAMTANARGEDHALCLEAGMNEVVTKPFVPDLLLKVLAQWLTHNGTRHLPRPPVLPAAPDPSADAAEAVLWDDTRLGVFVGNNPSQQLRFLNKFLGSMEQFEQAVGPADSSAGKTVADAAHKIKSSARTVGAMRLAALCEQLEQAGRSGDNTECARLLALAQPCIAETRTLIGKQLQRLQATPV